VNHNLTAKPENMAVQEFTKTQQQNIQKQWKMQLCRSIQTRKIGSIKHGNPYGI
jgi:hypothetical protein